MLNFITKQHKVIFAAGAATGLAVLGLLKTKKARELAVKGVASSMIMKDKVLENVANIKEEADDIVSQAKVVAKSKCDCTTDCTPECTCEEN